MTSQWCLKVWILGLNDYYKQNLKQKLKQNPTDGVAE